MSTDKAFFSELAPEEVRLICDCGTTKTYPKNSILINEGDQTDTLYIILSGKVKIYVSDKEGREVILNILGPGGFFGELALIDEAPRSASVMTLETSSLGMVTKAGFQQCIAAHPEIAMKMMRILCRRIRSLTENVKNLALLDVYGRVARTLENLATPKNGELVIEQRLTHQDIASMVGASREMVSRIMKELTIGKYIHFKNKRITILKKLPLNW
jgi:CRP/FNR family cyclic AMP-dependent transcriptional regulator